MAQREIDDINKRKKYKDEKFGKRKTAIDEYTGKRIKRSNAEVDHIVSIENIKEKYSDLTTEQQKKLANSSTNYALTNSHLNRSKQGNSDAEHILNSAKHGSMPDSNTVSNMCSKQVQSERTMDKQAKKMRMNNRIDKIIGLFGSNK